MKGVAARYPAFSPALGRPVNLEQRINICRTDRQQAKPFAYESKDLLALTAFVGRQSRGEPIAVPDDAQTRKLHRPRPRRLHAPAGAAQSLLRAMPRSTTGAAASPVIR